MKSTYKILKTGRPGRKLFFAFCLLSVLFQVGCRKFVQVSPPATILVESNVYSTPASAASVLTSIYDNMAQGGLSEGIYSISFLEGLQADELTNYSSDPVLSQFYINALTSMPNAYFWTELYQEIYVANAAIEGVTGSTALSTSLKQQLIGEAEFMRAFLHFYAVNLYGSVPLVTTTNYLTNNTIKPSSSADVYAQIVSDLTDAQTKLSANFLAGDAQTTTTERVRPTQWAAEALLARVYLYEGKWDSAEAQATTVINNSALFSLDSLSNSFLMNSTEAIWQLEAANPGYNTLDGYDFILTGPPGSSVSPVAIDSFLLNSFEPGDERFSNWLGVDSSTGTKYYYPFKYKSGNYGDPVTEYLMVFRLAEQYLIRAEARAHEGTNLSGAASDLNVIRTRAGLPNTSASLQTDLLYAIYHERQVELFTEWGHRWFDLKRTARIDSVMGIVTPAKGGVWNSDWSLLPIPQSEILINSNLNQNPGYN
ncbi:MAG: RagB/SusD family nutrient uptake outer membrane protein [Puia sp.]|nr:RagB/SusD family nutrient uptake outer membrane protein [Puia sp.]